MVGFLPVKISTDLENSCPFLKDSGLCNDYRNRQGSWQGNTAILFAYGGTTAKMSLLHDPMMEIPCPLPDSGSAIFEVNGVEKNICNCFVLIVSYSGNIPEWKDMSRTKHGTAVTIPFLRLLRKL